MSADNGVYVLSSIRNRRKEGNGSVSCVPYKVYRVAHAQAIDNFDWYQANEPYNLGCYIQDIWGNSNVFESLNEALEAANVLAQKIVNNFGVLEYGISVIEAGFILYQDNP